MASSPKPSQNQNAVKVEFIQGHLETAILFGQLAVQSNDEKENSGYRQKAYDAYEEALHSLRTVTLTDVEFESIRTKLQHLESILMADLP